MMLYRGIEITNEAIRQWRFKYGQAYCAHHGITRKDNVTIRENPRYYCHNLL